MDEAEDFQLPRGTRLIIVLAFAAAALSLILTVIDNNLKKQVIRESLALREAVRSAAGETGRLGPAGGDGTGVRGDELVSDAGAPPAGDPDADHGGGVGSDVQAGP